MLRTAPTEYQAISQPFALPMTLTEIRWGLCASCRWARPVRTRRGSTFLRCARSEHDPQFPKYPPLPVRDCAGYAKQPPPDERDERAVV